MARSSTYRGVLAKRSRQVVQSAWGRGRRRMVLNGVQVRLAQACNTAYILVTGPGIVAQVEKRAYSGLRTRDTQGKRIK